MLSNINTLSAEHEVPFEAYVIDRPEEMELVSHTITGGDKSIWVIGKAGVGKTTFLNQLLKRHNDYFKKYRIDFAYTKAWDNEKLQTIIEDAITKPEYETTLIVIDESEQLNTKKIEYLLRLKLEHNNIKYLFSSRKKPKISDFNLKKSCTFLNLKSPDLFSVLQRRLQLLQDGEIKHQASEIFNEYFRNFSSKDKTPRDVLKQLNTLYQDYPEAEKYIKKESAIDVEEDESGKIIDVKIDYVGIIFALVLFLISQFSSNQSEKKLTEQVGQIDETVKSVLSQYVENNESLYFVNRRVNFREEPNTKSHIIRKLEQNILVTLIEKQNGWLYVKYSDYVKNNEQYGWVYGKYVSKI